MKTSRGSWGARRPDVVAFDRVDDVAFIQMSGAEMTAIKRDVARGYEIAKKNLGIPDSWEWEDMIKMEVEEAGRGRERNESNHNTC